MNKKILLANVGNRNIMYRGEFYNELFQQGEISLSFRDWTHELLKEFNQNQELIQFPIIRQFFEETEYQPDIIFLFASNSPAGLRNDQDTVYAAEIIKRLLGRQFPKVATNIIEVDRNVIDENTLIRFYAEKFNAIKKMFPDGQFLINESGGTPQQVFALKTCSYFILPAFCVQNLIVGQHFGQSKILRNVPEAFFELLKS